ncbi:interleukin-21 [Clinocottus analis]|uniref:interleukin-21 n=1 Tax=Clinocottus analis TaxID=304258 RepID=UPI0035C1C37C
MKLLVFCLFAVWFGSLAGVSTHSNKTSQRKLQEVWRQLDIVKQSLQHGEKMMSTPPLSVEDSCCLSALRCFQKNLREHFNMAERTQRKLHKSLKSSLTATCQDCNSHPKENAKEFLNRLESLIQKGISSLS